MRYPFPKKMRLCRQEEFDAVFHLRVSVSDAVLVVYGIKNNLAFSRLGLKVSKKRGGKRAVDRNYWKRLIREVFRLSQHDIPIGLDLVVLPRQGVRPEFEIVRASFCRLVSNLVRKWERMPK